MTTILATTRAARRRGVLYVALLGVSVLMMAFSSHPLASELQRGVGFAFRPFQDALASVARDASSIVAAINEIERLRVTNQALEQRNNELEAESARLDEIRRENELLTGLLQLRSGLDYDTVAAEVIARDSSEFQRVVTINQGTDRGIAEGDVVIAAGGALAGRIIQAGPNFARVLLINDTASTVIGQVQTTAATGEVIGQLGGVLIMQNIDATERIQLGDQVVTAGIELGSGVRSPFPKGLLIGQIVDVARDANAVVQTAYLAPTAEIDRLEYVLVVTNYEGGLPPAGELPTDEVTDEGTLPEGEQPFVTPSPGAP